MNNTNNTERAGMTTRAAFTHLTKRRGWYALCDLNPDTARSLKRHHNAGKVSDERMSDLLKKAGYVLIPAEWVCM